ncbi:DUF7919 family protein [Yinghuangia soli]
MPDLAPYCYRTDGRELLQFQHHPHGYLTWAPPHPLVAVGWLDADVPQHADAVPEDVVEKLRLLVLTQRINGTCGLHFCGFCPPDVDEVAREDLGRVPSGSAEIRVASPCGSFAYAAPSLIGHYVEDHGYVPPAEFVDAVRALQPGDMDRFLRARIPDDAEYLDVDTMETVPFALCTLPPDASASW